MSLLATSKPMSLGGILKEETKKDRRIALKVIEEDNSDLDEEEMVVIIRKFKEFFKKAKEISKKKNFSKARNGDREQLTGCFKSGKHDQIVKNCPLLKEEPEQEQLQKQGRKQVKNSFTNSSA